MFSQSVVGNPSDPNLASHSASLYGLLRSTLIAALILGLAACSSPFGPRATATSAIPTDTPAPPTATPEPAAAAVNGEPITAREFEAQLAQFKAAQTSLGKTVGDQDAARIVIEDLIAQVLLAQAAKAQDFELSDPALQARLDGLQSQAGGADQLVKWEIDNGYSSPNAFRSALKRSVEAAWMRDKIVTAVPHTADQVHVQQILLYNQGNASSVLEQLKAGADFNDLASRYDAATRGDLGWFPKGYLLEPKIEEAAFSLQVGAYSDVIQAEAGFSIIKVLERDPNHPLAPDAYRAAQEAALRAWVSQQRAAAKVVLAP